jgi:hypothetical protein
MLALASLCGSAIGVVVVSAVLVVASGSDARCTVIGLLVAACFALGAWRRPGCCPPPPLPAASRRPSTGSCTMPGAFPESAAGSGPAVPVRADRRAQPLWLS